MSIVKDHHGMTRFLSEHLSKVSGRFDQGQFVKSRCLVVLTWVNLKCDTMSH